MPRPREAGNLTSMASRTFGKGSSSARAGRSGGGKGANQAVGAARAGGAETAMVGAVGADADGNALLADLSRNGIDVTGIRRLDEHPTGVALITIDAAAENTIIVAAGANAAPFSTAGAN